MTEPLWRRVLRLHGPDPRADVEAEFAFHIEERTEALMAKGMSKDDARDLALRQFGDLSGAAATCSDIGSRRASRLRWRERVESVAQDLTYAIKAMRRSPGFTLAAVATIALGIGANTVVFSLLNALLFQPLDANNPRELVRVYTSESAIREARDRFGGSSYADYVDLRKTPALAELAAFMPLGATIQLNGAPARFEARLVSDNYFNLLGRPLFRGGWQTDSTSRETEAIVSHHFWVTQLARDPDVIGRSLSVNGRTVRVAGVTSADFRGVELSTVDLYLPFSAAQFTGRADFLMDRGARSVKLLGRLAPGVTASVAERELDAVMRALGEEYPTSNAKRSISARQATAIVPLELVGDAVAPRAGLIFGATLVMLAIAGVNVAAVLLGRTIRRRRELAVRLSLGASPFRIVRQLVTESVLLALIASAVVVVLVALLPVLGNQLGVPRSVQSNIDLTVLAYAVGVAGAFGILFGLAPAMIGTRSDVVESLRSGEADARPTKARAQKVLVCAQLALSMLLLLVGGALLGSLNRQQRVDPGFSVERLVVGVFEDPLGVADVPRERAFTRLAVERLAAIPGVGSVSVASMAPLSGDGFSTTIHVPGYVEAPNEDMDIAAITGGPDLFKTLGIPIRRGRELTWVDRDTMSKVIVNELMARRYWGTRDPIGTLVYLGGKGGRPAEVIAVAANAHFRSLAEAPHPMFAIQRVSGGGATVLIRSSGESTSLLNAVRGVMSRSDVLLTLVELRTMEEILRSSLAVSRAVSATLVTIGILAVLLAAVGLYGVVSYVMGGRTREFGVRLALGASPGSITRLVLGYGMRLTAVGGAVGTILGLAAVNAMGGMGEMLFGSWSSAPIVAVVAAVLCAVTLVACAIPAFRATATSPATALRSD